MYAINKVSENFICFACFGFAETQSPPPYGRSPFAKGAF